MSKLNIDQKTIAELFQDKKADFLIPDYQRPYAWEDDECDTLWEDIFSFAFPGDSSENFNETDEYYLGSMVFFQNENKQLEVIDGQQRLTTLLLLLRAFYNYLGDMKDSDLIEFRKDIEKCIWKTNENRQIDKDKLKINSEVIDDKTRNEFLEILKTGIAEKDYESRYAKNFKLFIKKIDDTVRNTPKWYLLIGRLLDNCVILPIEAESQDTALRIFSTLNDRGLPLSDADIFKAQLYKFYSEKNKKDEFIKQWRELEESWEMETLFTHYMYYERALQKNKSSTTEALRKFYEKENYALLKNEKLFNSLIKLANFWNVYYEGKLSDKILKRLFVLEYAPNQMWDYFVTVYFMHNSDEQGNLDEEKFYLFLKKITAFIWAYAVTNPGVSTLRGPVFAEMVNIIEDKPVTFASYKFDAEKLKTIFHTYEFSNGKPITKSMLAWWACNDENQELLSLDTTFEIEHIFAKKRAQFNSLKNPENLEVLGNKSLLEKRINIRAADYRFADKKKYYNGFKINNKEKEGTKIRELINLANTMQDFTESDIEKRNEMIVDGFIQFLGDNGLLK